MKILVTGSAGFIGATLPCGCWNAAMKSSVSTI
jgi:nucleoside-diphosphate-sugar epimerase